MRRGWFADLNDTFARNGVGFLGERQVAIDDWDAFAWGRAGRIIEQRVDRISGWVVVRDSGAQFGRGETVIGRDSGCDSRRQGAAAGQRQAVG